MSDFPTQARVVIIGGGAVGATAEHDVAPFAGCVVDGVHDVEHMVGQFTRGAVGAVFLDGDGHVEQVLAVSQTAGELVQGLDDLGQHGTLAAQCLGVLRLVPDVGVFQLAVDFDQAVMLVIVVKDTPELTGNAR